MDIETFGYMLLNDLIKEMPQPSGGGVVEIETDGDGNDSGGNGNSEIKFGGETAYE